jgi:(S)-mandelate dehydrogenase
MTRHRLPRLADSDRSLIAALAGLGCGLALGAALRRDREAERPLLSQPNRHTTLAQLDGSPERRWYTGRNLDRAVAIADLRAMTHRFLPRFALEYLEGGAEDEATLMRERRAYADWRFVPRTLVDVSHRTLRTTILGKPSSMPLMVAPTGLNGVFRRHADIQLAEGAAAAGVPFIQSTMSNDRMEDVAKIKGLRHWWQLYVFGADEVWQEVIRRADAAGCEALVLTTNTQIFGNREWQARTQATRTRLSVPSAVDAALHPEWFAETLLAGGMPSFVNIIDLAPKDHRRFFDSSDWIRRHQPTSMSWDTVAAIRERWKKPFILKGLLSLDDVRRALDSGVDGIALGSHGGRQLDWTVSALDLLPQAREIVGDRMALYVSGGLRRGTDLLKALCLGADAVMAGRAPLYGVCAAGSAGVHRALEILRREATDAMGLLGAPSLKDLGPRFLVRAGHAPPEG